ncbi:hypothetical protein HK103_006513 [Boothiomyces macroporosus]|uniref:Nucleoporin n=1 Tax=Boothiomyces macroporosus TaxID=261099 RepID=A0AAD5UL80_9FUNG|nr:hypothetical protein HK103_006513 [Boothiomyces macroporosus]
MLYDQESGYLEPNQIFVWTLFDLFFLVLLRMYSRPRIKYLGIIISALCLFLINCGVVAFYSQELIEPESDYESSLLNDSFILGSITVNIKPPTLCQINTSEKKICLRENTNISISMKGKGPFEVKYTLHPHKPTLFTTESDHFEIPVTDIGVFELNSVKGQDAAKILNNQLISIYQCPTYEWKQTENVCLNEQINLGVEVTGVGPFEFFYLEKIGNDERIVDMTIPIEKKEISTIDKSKEEIIKELLKEIEPVRKLVNIPLRASTTDQHLFSVVRIIDGNENAITWKTKSTLPYLKNDIQLDTIESKEVTVYPLPSSTFDKSELKIKTVYDAQVEQAPNVDIDIVSYGNGPFTLDLEFIRDDSIAQPLHFENIDYRHSFKSFEGGYYRLLKVKDRYCENAIEKQQIQIKPVLPPTFSFTQSTIEESCFGTVGTNVDFVFTGSNPFYLHWHIEKTVNGQTLKLKNEVSKFEKNRAELVLKPQEPGTYKYVFDRVGIPIDQSFKQIIHPHSNARFTSSKSFIKCKNEPIILNINAMGTGPWKIDYDITFGSKLEKRSLELKDENSELKLEFEKGGIYQVELTEITDGNGCKRKLSTEITRIEIVDTVPTVSLPSLTNILVLENTLANVPIALFGRGPFSLRYKKDSKEETIRLENGARYLKIHQGPGTYELLSLSDSVCQGKIEGTNRFQITNIPKPTIEIKKQIIEPKCQFEPNHFQLDLTGKPPFKIQYQTSYNKDPFLSVVELDYLRLETDTTRPGKQTFKINSISDENYKQPIQQAGLIIEQEVYELPKGEFTKPSQQVYHCLKQNNTFSLDLELTGQPPFKGTIQQLQDNNHVKYIDFETSGVKQGDKYKYQFNVQISQMGKHEFILDSLRDSRCTGKLDEFVKPSTFIEINDQASMTSLNPPSICIGDMLSYTLQGTPPFSITYNWKKEQTVTLNDPVFNVWVGKPGKFEIKKICNKYNCCQEYTTLSTTINTLPKAIIADGSDLITDINQGDSLPIRIHFEGQGPYSFTYTRKNKKMVESFSVENVEKEYVIETGLEGVFKVTSVKDQVCSFPKRIASTAGANIVLNE